MSMKSWSVTRAARLLPSSSGWSFARHEQHCRRIDKFRVEVLLADADRRSVQSGVNGIAEREINNGLSTPV
jgi:hypothetical protein